MLPAAILLILLNACTPLIPPTTPVVENRFMGSAEIFFQDQELLNALRNKRLGLITNQTGVDDHLRSFRKRLAEAEDLDLVRLFAPEHGINGNVAAGDSVSDGMDPETGLPVYSLYGIKSGKDPFLGLDAVIYDIQDTGVRPYTYISILYETLEAAAESGLRVVVLDRPNPLGGTLVDGPLLEPDFRSFIGIAPIPYVYGLTVGELAIFFNENLGIGAKLHVVTMQGWRPESNFGDLPLAWVPTSPNIPSWETAFYNAATGAIGELGQVNLGVGTPLPFQIIGAPWIKPRELIRELECRKLPGVHFLPYYYRVTRGRFKGEEIPGILLRVTDWYSFRPVTTQLHLLEVLNHQHPKGLFASAAPEKLAMFRKAMGTARVDRALSEGMSARELAAEFSRQAKNFLASREHCLLYPREKRPK